MAVILSFLSACGSVPSVDISSEATFSQTVSDTSSQTTVDVETNDGESAVTEFGTIRKYPTLPDELPKNYDYEVSISQGDVTYSIPVYDCARKKDSFNSIKNTDLHRRFCEFEFSGEVTVKIRPRIDMASYILMPSPKGIESIFENGVITFKLTKAQDIVLRLNEDDQTNLAIFAYAPETDIPKEGDDGVLYFKKGYNNVSEKSAVQWELDESGLFHIPSNTIVYLEPGALVSSRMRTRNNNVTVKGRGAFIDIRMERNSDDYAFMFAVQNFDWDKYISNFTVQDVKFLDAHTYSLCFSNTKNVHVDNVKILANQISTDGISFFGNVAEDIMVENCFIYVGDVAFVYSCGKNFKVQNCFIGTRQTAFEPRSNIELVEFENIYAFMINRLFSDREAAKEGYSWNTYIKNVYAEDSLELDFFMWFMYHRKNPKTAVFENVSLPQNPLYVYFHAFSETEITLNNVFVGGIPLESEEQFSNDSDYYNEWTEVEFKFGKTFDKSAANVGSYEKALKKVAHQGDIKVVVGGETLPNYKVPTRQYDGEIYVPALEVLTELGFNASYSCEMLTFSREGLKVSIGENSAKVNGESINSTYKLKFEDKVLLLPVSVLALAHIEYKFSDNTLFIQAVNYKDNLLDDGGFENILNTEISKAEQNEFRGYLTDSKDYITFNFAPFYAMTNDVHSGKTALRVIKTKGWDCSGVAQNISNQIARYGKGTYRFECYVKLSTNQEHTEDKIYMGIAQNSYRVFEDGGKLLGINDLKEFTLTNEWQKITYDVVINDVSKDGYDRANFFVGFSFLPTDDSVTYDFLVDDASLTFLN